MKFVSELYNRYPGSDIYVVGTGASLRVFPLSFLEDKIVIGLNMAWKVVPVKYSVTIHPNLNIPAFIPGEELHPEITWISGYFKTNTGGIVLKGVTSPELVKYAKKTFYFFEYHGQANTQPPNQPSASGRVLDWVRKPTENYLYVWSSISQTGVNLAANMGAKNIFLVGCDNCSLLKNHHAGQQHTRWKGVDPNLRYKQYYQGLAEVRTVLRERNINLLNITPFLSLTHPEEDFERLCEELDKPKLIENIDVSLEIVSDSYITRSGKAIRYGIKKLVEKIRIF